MGERRSSSQRSGASRDVRLAPGLTVLLLSEGAGEASARGGVATKPQGRTPLKGYPGPSIGGRTHSAAEVLRLLCSGPQGGRLLEGHIRTTRTSRSKPGNWVRQHPRHHPLGSYWTRSLGHQRNDHCRKGQHRGSAGLLVTQQFAEHFHGRFLLRAVGDLPPDFMTADRRQVYRTFVPSTGRDICPDRGPFAPEFSPPDREEPRPFSERGAYALRKPPRARTTFLQGGAPQKRSGRS